MTCIQHTLVLEQARTHPCNVVYSSVGDVVLRLAVYVSDALAAQTEHVHRLVLTI